MGGYGLFLKGFLEDFGMLVVLLGLEVGGE